MDLDILMNLLISNRHIILLFFVIAILYSSVGFGGGSSYLAILALTGIAFTQIRAISLLCNIVVVGLNVCYFQRQKLYDWKKVIPMMRKQEENDRGLKGNIINVSSIAGKIPFAYASAYISSKFAIEGISECIQDEVEDKGIKINIIEPGVVKTNFFTNTKTINPDDSPYLDIVNLWTNTAKKLFEVTLTSSEDVAEKIFECIEDSESELRIPVGEDAKQFLDMHHEYSDNPKEFKKWFADQMQKLFDSLK